MWQDISNSEITQEEKEKLIAEKFQSLTIKDDFMFCQVMQDEAICTKVLNILLQDYFKIGKIKLAKSQATIKNHPELKFVRLDVLAIDEAGNSYDIEMQVVNQRNIEKRMRAYQVAIDMFKMQKGMEYNELTNTIIIFITPFDPFDAGLPVYFFEFCSNTYNTNVKMSDGTYRVVFNTSAYKNVKDAKLRELLKFFDTGKATMDVTKEMKMKVSTIKKDSIIFSQFFSTFASMMDARKDGRDEGWLEGKKAGIAEGKKAGREEGSYEAKIETAKKLLNMGLTLENISIATGLAKEKIETLK